MQVVFLPDNTGYPDQCEASAVNNLRCLSVTCVITQEALPADVMGFIVTLGLTVLVQQNVVWLNVSVNT